MSWQDAVFSVGQWILIIALIPTLLGKKKPAATTCFLYGVILSAFTIAYFSMSFWMTTVATALSALIWFVIGIQGILKK